MQVSKHLVEMTITLDLTCNPHAMHTRHVAHCWQPRCGNGGAHTPANISFPFMVDSSLQKQNTSWQPSYR